MRTNRAKCNAATAAIAVVTFTLFGPLCIAHGQESAPRLTLDPAFAETVERPNLLADAGDAGGADGWSFRLGLPLWIPGIDGEIQVRDRTLTTDQSTEDVVGVLDDSLEFAFAGHLEAQKGRFGVFTDVMYIAFGAEKDTRFGTEVEVDADMWIGELGAFYALVAPKPADKHPFRLELLGGVRVTGFSIEIDTDRRGSADRDKDWFDPFVGLRAELGVLDWLALRARGDIGGFGISEGNTSDFSWNVLAAVQFKVAKWMDIDLGYRWLDYDYEDGSGDDRFELDATLHGPFVMLTFNF